jgi:cysteine desulfurase
MIYLDYNATTPIDPAVAEAMRPFIYEQFGNPSSSHPLGRAARQALEAARASLASLIGASPGEIVFTSGGTESSNWAILGTARQRQSAGRHMVTTTVEHPATREPMRALERLGFESTEVEVDGTALVDPDDVRRAIRPDTILISVMHAQNEVGTIEPVAEIGRIARQAGVLFHVDAAQSVGKIPVDVDEMGADLVSIAGHKMYAPKGIGALYIRRGVDLEPLIHGASQESGRRAGTENVVMAVGLGQAAELAAAHIGDGSLEEMRDYFWGRLSTALGERVVLNGHPTKRLPSTLNVSFPGRMGGEILAKLEGVWASTGAACHSGDAKPSAVLTAMGLDVERAVGAIRFSVGRPTRQEEIDRVMKMLISVLAN